MSTIVSATLGNGLTETSAYDTRGRVTSGTVSAGYSYALTYAANGDVTGANDSVNGNWTYTYDAFNRLSTAVNSAQGSTYANTYDRYGNRWDQELNGQCTPGTAFCVGFDANNHTGSLQYDAAGNVKQDSAHQYYYDAEDRLIQVDGTLGTCSAPTTACYVYDAEGRRVQKTVGSVTVNYVYAISGEQIAEVSSSGGVNRIEAYAGGKHLATYTNGTIYFDHADWLGTERMRTTASGAGCETITSLAFGDGMATSGSCSDASPMHFTGKMHDNESNLDDFDARYYSSQWGRFISADWSAVPAPVPYANFANPQTLNLYAIVADNPDTFADLNGHSSSWGLTTMAPTGGCVGACSCNSEQAPGACLAVAETREFATAGTRDADLWDPVLLVSPMDDFPQAQNTNQQTRADIAATANKYKGSADWAYDKKKGAFACNTWKCNEFVGDVTKEAGAPAEIHGRYPLAGEWADKKTKIGNWRVLGADEKPEPGDVAAYKIPGCQGGCTGHSGIVVGVDSQGVHVIAAHADVVGRDDKFQPTNPGVVYRRYTGGE